MRVQCELDLKPPALGVEQDCCTSEEQARHQEQQSRRVGAGDGQFIVFTNFLDDSVITTIGAVAVLLGNIAVPVVLVIDHDAGDDASTSDLSGVRVSVTRDESG